MKKYLPIIVIGFVVLILIVGVAKLLDKPKSPTGETPSKTSTPFSKSIEELSESQRPKVEIKQRADGKALNVTFSNLKNFISLQYELSYLTKDEIPQGVIGTPIALDGKDSITKELLLGTCSGTVTLKCRYDENVHQISLTAKYTDKNGELFDQTVEYNF